MLSTDITIRRKLSAAGSLTCLHLHGRHQGTRCPCWQCIYTSRQGFLTASICTRPTCAPTCKGLRLGMWQTIPTTTGEHLSRCVCTSCMTALGAAERPLHCCNGTTLPVKDSATSVLLHCSITCCQLVYLPCHMCIRGMTYGSTWRNNVAGTHFCLKQNTK